MIINRLQLRNAASLANKPGPPQSDEAHVRECIKKQEHEDHRLDQPKLTEAEPPLGGPSFSIRLERFSDLYPPGFARGC